MPLTSYLLPVFIWRCKLKKEKKFLLAVSLAIVLISKPADNLFAQFSPPIPPMFNEAQAEGAEGTMLRGTEGTAFQLRSPSTVPPPQVRTDRETLPPPVMGRTPKPVISAPLLPQQEFVTSPKASQGRNQQPSASTQPVQTTSSQPQGKNSDRMVTLDFNNVDLQTFVKFISELTGKNFVIDEKVQGKITVISPTKISVDEAYQVFLTVLDMKGFTAVTENKVIKIFPSREAKQSNVSIVTEEKRLPLDDNYETRILKLKHIGATELSRLISPLISKDGSSIPYPSTNVLIITDITSNMKKLLSLIEELDTEPPKGKGGIYVYYLQNAGAEDMSKVLSNLVSKVPPRPAGGQQPPQDSSVHFEGGISVTADKATNSLIIMASPEDYERIISIIERLDVKRKQVYVEAAIVEMSLTKSREIGVEWRGTEGISATDYTFTGGTQLGGGLSSFVANPLGVNGLAIAAIKGTTTIGKETVLNVGALIRMFQEDSEINILSTPNILTLDNQEAKIIVGQNVPFITGVSQTAGGNVQATIERKDVGIQLKITPHTTDSDLVKLDIYQEISSLGENILVGPSQNVPVTLKRSAETSVMVTDNETVAIGGLIKDDVTNIERKVPLLGDIPLLGYLFKYQTKKKIKTNLLIFLTPHIIRDSQALERISSEKRKIAEDFRKKYKFELKEGFILNPPTAPTKESK